ncbi:YhcB family protein [Marinobacterium sp. D7]|uniref:YhcB family protein n=1 Tax=Marinobacterium ramblicola TaxID=2849041 RepID=UPI001C2CC8BB|nr:YhcB family protein [Marinobacterium ramblicola]
MEVSNAWTLSLVGVAIGLVIGYLLGRSNSGRQQEMASELDAARAELNKYKDEVTEHFETTAELVNGLTEQYRRVHQHLASGAQTLCTNEQPGEALQASLQPRLHKQDIPTVTDAVDNAEAEELPEPPRDYAPKRDDQEGTLSDRYGLKAAQEEDEGEHQTPTPDVPAKKKAARVTSG